MLLVFRNSPFYLWQWYHKAVFRSRWEGAGGGLFVLNVTAMKQSENSFFFLPINRLSRYWCSLTQIQCLSNYQTQTKGNFLSLFCCIICEQTWKLVHDINTATTQQAEYHSFVHELNQLHLYLAISTTAAKTHYLHSNLVWIQPNVCCAFILILNF